MSQAPVRTVSQDSTDGIRKRVCKACDRCRLKKSKCDGAHPCSRCKADNAICVFGERKKSHDKVYPKGYVEMLEQQQSQLVSGLQEMYKRLQDADAWSGAALSEANGHPLTHDILAALDLLEVKQDGSGDMESFEEDCQKLQNRLLSEGAGYVQRRGSFSSESEHSQRGQHSRTVSQSTPTMVQTPIFRDSFSFGGSPIASPTLQSPAQLKPALRQVQSFAAQPSTPMHLHHHHGMTPIHHHGHGHGHPHGALPNDPQLYQPDWALPDMSTPDQVMRAKFALQSGQMMPHQQHPHHGPPPHLGPHQRPPMSASHHAALSQQQQQAPQQPPHAAHAHPPAMFESNQFDTPMPTAFVDAFHPDLQLNSFAPGLMQNGTVDFGMDPMEMDFNKFISVTT